MSSPRRCAEQALLRAARRLLDVEPDRSAASDTAPLDWPRVLEIAERERLAPLLEPLARRCPRLPPGVLERLRAAWADGANRHLLGMEALGRLLDAFAAADIPVIPLKGPALAEALYDDPALRPFTDLDLLVRHRDVPRAVALLGDLGYRALEHERSLAYELAYATAACFVPREPGSGRVPIDLHWGLVSFPAAATPPALDVDEVWTRAVVAQPRGRPLLALCREDLLLSLALHLAVHHPLQGLQWQLDLALLVRRSPGAIAWDAVVERAARWQTRGAVYFALARVNGRLAAGVPAAVLAALRPAGPRGAWLERLARRGEQPPGWLDYLIAILVMDRPGDFVRGVAAGALPGPAWMRLRYPEGSIARAYVAHYRRILTLVRS